MIQCRTLSKKVQAMTKTRPDSKKRNPKTFTRVIALLVAESFLVTTLLPPSVLAETGYTPNTFLRPVNARKRAVPIFSTLTETPDGERPVAPDGGQRLAQDGGRDRFPLISLRARRLKAPRKAYRDQFAGALGQMGLDRVVPKTKGKTADYR